jgi:hypothetical protein
MEVFAPLLLTSSRLQGRGACLSKLTGLAVRYR